MIPLAPPFNGTDDDSNIRCLCGPCHKIRTAEQFGHRMVHGTDVNGRPLDPAHPWNRTLPPGAGRN
ncbi:hypothetical protein [Rhodopseudomonas sp. RCAM05734]|uniref:hypothetical protein n=1 Tax=Rhodopseudomonas sp. RCAM05734 TaxID=3457549 RepID=UPI004043C387